LSELRDSSALVVICMPHGNARARFYQSGIATSDPNKLPLKGLCGLVLSRTMTESTLMQYCGFSLVTLRANWRVYTRCWMATLQNVIRWWVIPAWFLFV